MSWLRRSGAAVSAVLATPLLGAAWLARPRWRPGLGERLGAIPAAGEGAVWVHAASVGEATAALRLLDALGARGRAVRASTTTITGRAVLTRSRPELPVHLAPLDHPYAVARALGRARPAALVLVETELWPSWIAGAHRRGVPVLVVSGRISDRALPRYRRLRRVFAATLSRLAAVGARSAEDAERFAALGVPAARISVTGDLKLEPRDPPPVASDLDAALGSLAWVVAGSVHPGELPAVLEGFAAVRGAAGLVIAPRHPERFAEAERTIRAAGLPCRRRSTLGNEPLAAGDVLLLDTLGELAGLYARAATTFVGGSLVPGIGGHNVLEPVFAGRPVSFGPHTQNAREAAALVLASEAGTRVDGAEALGLAFRRDLADPTAAATRGAAGRAALAPHEGAAERAADCIEAVLVGGGRR